MGNGFFARSENRPVVPALIDQVGATNFQAKPGITKRFEF